MSVKPQFFRFSHARMSFSSRLMMKHILLHNSGKTVLHVNMSQPSSTFIDVCTVQQSVTFVYYAEILARVQIAVFGKGRVDK